MTMALGITIKQRIREAVWKTQKEVDTSLRANLDDILSRKLQPFYRETFGTKDPTGYHGYVVVRAKGVLETQRGTNAKDKVRDHMRRHNLPGGQVTFSASNQPTIQWLQWYDGFIFPNGDLETLTEDPASNRNFSLDDDARARLKRAIHAGINAREGKSLKDAIFESLKNTYKETYKEKYIPKDLMADVVINDVCVMEIRNRNTGFVMAADLLQMKKYMNELLIPGVLANFTNGVLTTFVWFSSTGGKLGMAIEILNEIPSDQLCLSLDESSKNTIRDSVLHAHNDKGVQDERAYRDAIVSRLKDTWPDVHKDRFLDGHMPDITVGGRCILDIRTRNRGIVMNKDRYAMKAFMVDLRLPAVQINFIDGTSAVILWFSCEHRDMSIELEAQGEAMSGASLIDFL